MTPLMQAEAGARASLNQGFVVFTTLAMNQTRFFAALGRALSKMGFHTAYVCFHEPSYEYLVSGGARAYNAFEMKAGSCNETRLDKHYAQNMNMLMSHEKAAYEIFNSARLLQKFNSCTAVMESVLDDLARESKGKTWLVQELGGFLSVVAGFYAARARGIDNIFIEPSFFRGRVFFVRNSFTALSVPGPDGAELTDVVKDYLDRTVKKQNIIVPAKDALQYRSAAKKLVDTRNIRRLVEKLRDKYIYGKHEEFQYIGGHVKRHLRMFTNSIRLRRFYRPLPEHEQFVYYPLHVPADVSLTLRSPEYLDQFALIDFISRSVPNTHKVAIKEHPALVGAVGYSRIRELLKRCDNIILLNPNINNYTVLNATDAVITVNSKSGAEALLLGKPVVVLGDSFYRACRLVKAIDRLSDLPQVLSNILQTKPILDPILIQSYFQSIWNYSLPGELYDTSTHNLAIFVNSLHTMFQDVRETRYATIQK